MTGIQVASIGIEIRGNEIRGNRASRDFGTHLLKIAYPRRNQFSDNTLVARILKDEIMVWIEKRASKTSRDQ